MRDGRKRWLGRKLDEKVVDTTAVVARPRPKFFPASHPPWRHDVFSRVGIPVLLGAVAAAMGAWLIGAQL